MKSISCTDLLLIDEFKGWKVFDLINPINDEKVYKYLDIMGIDLEYDIVYSASQHRNLQNKVVISYMIGGEININKHHLTSEWSSVYDRLVAAAYQDVDLCKDMCKQMNSSLDYSSFHEDGDTSSYLDTFPKELCNPDEADIAYQIKLLNDILIQIRGKNEN